jgi:hypothetical protein
VTGYDSTYNHEFDPPGAHLFRGNKNVVGGIDFDTYLRSMNLFGEIARNRSSGYDVPTRGGTAWTVTPMFRLMPVTLWTRFYRAAPDFFSRHADFASDRQPDRQSVLVGGEYKGQRYYNLTNWRNTNRLSRSAPSTDLLFENVYKLDRRFDVYFRLIWSRQPESETQKYRYQLTWTESSTFRYRFRYETVSSDSIPDQTRKFGHSVMGDVRYKPTNSLTLNARVYFFDSPAAGLSAGQEEIWDKTMYPKFAGLLNSFSGTPGQRFYLIVKERITRDLSLWLKFDMNHRPGDLTTIQSNVSGQQDKAFAASKYGFHMQADYRWGGASKRRAETEEPDSEKPSGQLGERE